MPALPVPEFRSYLRRPLPHPLTHKTYRQIAKDIGIPASTVNRFLNNPDDLTKRHMDALLGAYGLDWGVLFLLREYSPEIRLGRPVQVDPRNPAYDTAGNPLDPTHPHLDNTPRRKGLFGRPTTPLGPDEQRTPPPNLAPDTLFLPQTPKERAAGIPPTPRKMTREEFSSYDPEPEIIHPKHLKDSTPDWKDWTNPVWCWWDWRLNTRPGDRSDSNKEAAAESRAMAEFDGDETARTAKQRAARSAEILAALNHNPPLPIPPFDPADPRYVCEPAEPRRRGKGKKNKSGKSKKDSSE